MRTDIPSSSYCAINTISITYLGYISFGSAYYLSFNCLRNLHALLAVEVSLHAAFLLANHIFYDYIIIPVTPYLESLHRVLLLSCHS